jgi:probable rRNA maturation factor
MVMEHKIRVTAVVPVPEEEEVRALITRCAQAALEAEQVDFPAFVDITITDNAEIREINREYRDKDTATDVLSFPMFEFYNGEAREELEEDPESGCIMLGDMIISYERAVQQAADYGHSPQRECGFLTVHSVLHLLGYDHERSEEERQIMRRREEAILSGLGLTR